MPHMPPMPALQLRPPMPLFVLIETYNSPLHPISRNEIRSYPQNPHRNP